MSEVTVVNLRNRLGDVLGRVAYGRERVVVISRGQPKAAIISMEDLETLEDLEDAQAAREAMEEYERGETIPWEQVKAELGLTGAGADVPD